MLKHNASTIPEGLFGLVLTLPCVGWAVGCGDVYHTMVYDDATFTGPTSGQYNRMLTGELSEFSQIQHESVARVFIRLEDGTVFELSKVPLAEAQRRFPQPQTDPESDLKCYFLANSMFYFRDQELVGAVLADGMEFGTSEDGPFVKLPLSSRQIRDVLGEPERRSTLRASPKWN